MLTKKNHVILMISFLLFLALLPLSSKINFYQNDDWVYYKNVKSFLEGDFRLDEYTDSTFYGQGLLGSVFSRVFSLEKLPVLTLVFGICNFFIFTYLLKRFLNFTYLWAVMLGLLFFLNPINLYLLWGFMNGQYFLFFILASLYRFLNYEDDKNPMNILHMVILSFVALFVRQVALVIPLSFALWYFSKRRYKLSAIFFSTFLVMLGYLAFRFPATNAMRRAGLQFKHFLDFDYSFSLVFGIMLVITSFTLPLIISFVFEKFRNLNNKERVLVLIIGVVIYTLLTCLYKPQEISWGEYPYFENTFERTGFYPRGISGTKYHFAGNFDLFKYWDLVSKIFLSLFLANLVFDYKNNKKHYNIFLVFFVVYLAVMVMTETFYDRYLLVLIPLGIMYMVKVIGKESWRAKLLLGFVIFLLFLGYQLSMDFYHTNKYVWEKSWQIVDKNKLYPYEVDSTNAWNSYFFQEVGEKKYVFSFDSPEVSEEYACGYDLLETKKIEYPLNIFVNPKIYLYKLRDLH